MKKQVLFLIPVFLLIQAVNGFAFPVKFIDDSGKTCVIKQKPVQVVSLVPTITEIIYKLGAQDCLAGITHHSVFPGMSEKKIVGGFFEPSLKTVADSNPDMIFISSLHTEIKNYFKDKGVILIELKVDSVADGMEQIRLLGKILDRQDKARAITEQIDQEIGLINRKIARIPSEKKIRVMRFMGRDRLMTPGKNSFQNDLIRMAGGISHSFDREGDVIDVTLEEWKSFNPQVIYGCGKDSEVEKLILSQPGWKEVDAVKNRHIYYFPCDLTCRAATNTGYFIQWLAACVYGKEFSLKENQFLESRVISSKLLKPFFPYMERISIEDTHILDFLNKSFVIDLKQPMTIVSTLEGQRKNITTIINHYTPPQNWQIDHDHGIEAIRKRINTALGKTPQETSILITGVNMNNLVVKKSTHKTLEVAAFVTAGVESNAMRMGKSKGLFYEPGTINIILATNMKLSSRAMTRAIITATEAKTAALLDMDIRTSYDAGKFRATGTGTDNVLVLEGTGPLLNNSGGHTKLGEMIAACVYDSVKEAVFKQNGLSRNNNIFRRLKKRGITIYELIAEEICSCKRNKTEFVGKVEELLLEPQYAGFVQMTLSLSDDYEKGLIKDLSAFEALADQTAEKISGRKLEEIRPMIRQNLPKVIKIGLNALLNGIYYRED